MSSTLMISAALVSSLAVLRIRDCRTSSGVSPCPATSGMTATPVSKPERPSASLGNRTTAITIHIMGRLSWANRLVRQLARMAGSRAIVTSSHSDDGHVDREEDRDQADGQPDRFAETLQEDGAEQRDEHARQR